MAHILDLDGTSCINTIIVSILSGKICLVHLNRLCFGIIGRTARYFVRIGLR